ncbi:ABC transporter substrate-binding protein [Hydrogenophaga sp. 5NK40-0174]|uniref:MlaC/ttg2D family ABC transporter substrate-binding protein n=1 Tax=Hydrogenophaga sp. 5NK40-0174 TaxID=3127649 RepID=UPI00333F9D8E
MNRRHWLAAITISWTSMVAMVAHATPDEAPDALIKRISGEVLEVVKSDPAIQAGDTAKIAELVDTKIMPNVNFERMTASAVGRYWRQASAEQKSKLQSEFKTLLVRTYSGALAEIRDQTLSYRPFRANPSDTEVVVRSEVRGRGEPIQLDYRLEKTESGWKIFDLNVLGVWLVQTYRSQFAQEISTKGIDGLIATLSERNKANAS